LYAAFVVVKNVANPPSSMSAVMADILQTELHNADNVILAKAGRSSCTDTDSPAVKKKKTVHVTDDSSCVKYTLQTKAKAKKKKKKKLKSDQVDKSDSIDSGSDDSMDNSDLHMSDSGDNHVDGVSTSACAGLADVMHKILSKTVKNSNVILAKCETDKQRLLKKAEAQKLENVEESIDVSSLKSVTSEWQRAIKVTWLLICLLLSIC
jgi:hypothetical protein